MNLTWERRTKAPRCTQNDSCQSVCVYLQIFFASKQQTKGDLLFFPKQSNRFQSLKINKSKKCH